MEEKELLNERWDEQNSLLVESHERLVQELTDEYEYKLQEEQLALQRIKDEKDELMRELEETRKQVEEDADQEIEELKEKYEVKLAAERDQAHVLKSVFASGFRTCECPVALTFGFCFFAALAPQGREWHHAQKVPRAAQGD